MNDSDRHFGEAVIAHLCDGGQIDGIRFGPTLQILIANGSASTYVKGQVYLNLGSAWFVSDGAPAEVPESEDLFPQLHPEEEVARICEIREQTIVRSWLGADVPHLFFELGSGQVFCLNGHHDQYESWQLGVAFGDPNDTWLVVAGPDDAIAVWAPQYFSPFGAA